MGNADSKAAAGAISQPFPVNQKLSKELDKLSLVAARILGTPDIYDINNLARPGVCGDYAVFLKKGIEKKLLPFIADLSGGLAEVVYQNPRKAISDLDTRKKICSQMAETMLRAIATVVACLASIQVKSQSREIAVAPVPIQKGGDIPSLREWLRKSGYISEVDSKKNAGQPMDFSIVDTISPKFKFTLTLERTEGNLTYGFINAVNKPMADDTDRMPEGSLRIQFLNSFSIQAPGVLKTVLPLRIVDRAGNCWAAGILYEKYFKPFNTKDEYYITDLLERLFRRTQGAAVQLVETTDEVRQANEVFQRLRLEQSEQILYQTLGSWFAAIIPGFQAGYVPPPAYAPGFVGPGQPYPGQPYPGYAAQPYQAVRQLRPYIPIKPDISITPVTGLLHPMIGDTGYDIPFAATKTILDTLKSFRELIPKESSPAATRSITLAAFNNPENGTVQTGVCTDPYWMGQNLSKIYPWATLQFLSVKDWKTLTGDRTSIKFHPEWDGPDGFLSKLAQVYNKAPLLDRGTASAKLLDQIRFTKVAELPICKNNPTPRVKFQGVQNGLLSLQGRYDRHVSKMWAILNDLIFVIQDPDTKTDLVRLHPNVISATSNESSEAYVNRKSEEARKELVAFYIDVETTYMKSIETLQIV